MGLRFNAREHIKDNIYAYVLLIIAMILGIINANFELIAMKNTNIGELGEYVNNFFDIVGNKGVQRDDIIVQEFINIAKLLGIVWLCGSSIIGIPVIFYVVYMKGYILGFCSGVMIKTMGLGGIKLITVGILPKELFFIPGIIMLGVNGIKFSTYIMKTNRNRMIRKKNVLMEFGIYSIMLAIMCMVSLGGIGFWWIVVKYYASLI